MADRRRYDKRTKLAAVMAADMVGVTVAAEQSGIPKTTIQYWVERPEFAQFRTKAREELQDEIKVVAHLAWKRTAEALADGSMEPRDALFAAEKSTATLLLMSGEATQRSEHRNLGDELDDHERFTLRQLLSESLAEGEKASGDKGTGVDTATSSDPA